MNIVRIVIAGVFISIAFGISFLIAKTYAVGFMLSPQNAHTLMIVALCIPLVFIITMAIGQRNSAPSIQKLSYATNVLAGIALYLFLSTVLLCILMLFFGMINIPLPLWICAVCLCVGLSLGIAGIIGARYIKVVSYTVHLSGAPKNWNKKTAVLVSDTHFGLINHHHFSDKVIKQIIRLQPDFVLHAGDFYDGPKSNTSLISQSWKTLTATTPVFYTPGNHETYGDYAAFISSIKNAGVTVLTDTMTEYDSVQIAGITYRNRGQLIEVQRALEDLHADPLKALILINHPPIFQSGALSIGTNLMVSGHTHRGQFWPGQYIAKAVFGAYYYGLHEYKTLSTITTSGVGTAGPPLRLFNTPELVVIHFTTD